MQYPKNGEKVSHSRKCLSGAKSRNYHTVSLSTTQPFSQPEDLARSLSVSLVVGVVEELNLLIIGSTVIAIERGDDPRQVICTTPNRTARLSWIKVNCNGKTAEILSNPELGICIDSD